jgi:hypothetical protein
MNEPATPTAAKLVHKTHNPLQPTRAARNRGSYEGKWLFQFERLRSSSYPKRAVRSELTEAEQRIAAGGL